MLCDKKPYDKNKIGKFIGWGGEHLVFAYGEKEVIKFSMHVWLVGRTAVKKKKEDYKIGGKYFKEYLAPIKLLSWKNDRFLVEIQEKVSCRFFHRLDLENIKLKKQFDDIIKRHEKMKKEIGYGFDLFGREGLLQGRGGNEISNILVAENSKLILIDFTTMHVKPVLYEWPLWFFIRWASRRQEKLLKNFVK